jgi:S-adenosylmethionine:tRNA ribosyltransferase-isomerase
MRLADLEYSLPESLIAQGPAPERSDARLLVLERGKAGYVHARVADLPSVLRPGDLVVLNDTRVMAARVHGRRPSGGRVEVLFVRPRGHEEIWDVLVRGAPRVGERVRFADGEGEWVAPLGGGRWEIRMHLGEAVGAWLERAGEVPLPPYIRRPRGPTAADRERYQTVFARIPGAVAAPTAGLHFTPQLLERLRIVGIESATLTLHVGPGTFLPARGDDVDAWVMEPERYVLPEETAGRIAAVRARGGRVVAVGTTTVRTLESVALNGGMHGSTGEAGLFIRPGHRFLVVDALLTNFHLPRSSLLALVMALAGRDRVLTAYAEAVRLRYRFYSFGDAMLIT